MIPLLIFWGQWDNARESIEDVSVSKSMRETFKYSDSTYNFLNGDKFDFFESVLKMSNSDSIDD